MQNNRVRRETLIGFKKWLKRKMTTVTTDTQSEELKFDYEDVLLIIDFTLRSLKENKKLRKALDENLQLFTNGYDLFGHTNNKERAKRICKVLYGHEDVGEITWKKD